MKPDEQNPVASPADLPPLLQNPPWLAKKRQNPLPVLDVTTLATEERLHWTSEELASRPKF